MPLKDPVHAFSGSTQEIISGSSSAKIAILIPAYKPLANLLEINKKLLDGQQFEVIVVDDGSGQDYHYIFDQLATLPKIHLLRHAVNLGKGAALKTGMNYALNEFPDLDGIVTADADGQHHVQDILSVANQLTSSPGKLILGVRQFEQDVPLRNRLGNVLTRHMVRFLMGQKISDTQTGLRGVPRPLMFDLMRVSSSGYEFELEMLTMAKHKQVGIEEVAIRTIYDHPDHISHFNPLVDSMKIYFVLLRFGFVSLMTAALDNLVFYLIYRYSFSIAIAQIIARTCAVVFNYTAARNAVFLSREKHVFILPKYLALVAVNGLVSYALILSLITHLQLPVIWAKLLAESVLFLANFAIQRDFVFRKNTTRAMSTDWTDYYKKVPFTAKFTRKYTTSVLISVLQRYCGNNIRSLVEIGGANSCFLDDILKRVNPQKVHIIDLNEFGIQLLRERLGTGGRVSLHHQNCLTAELPELSDAVFSVGLVEHFNPANTREATLAHFRLVRPGGIVIISFPTPTWLYRLARSTCEALGLWKFPDERPLAPAEVLTTIEERGTVLFEKTLWPLILTQHMIVARKNS